MEEAHPYCHATTIDGTVTERKVLADLNTDRNRRTPSENDIFRAASIRNTIKQQNVRDFKTYGIWFDVEIGRI